MNDCTTLSWIAVDWGTTNLRIWLMDGSDKVLKSLTVPTRMDRLASNQFETVLMSKIEPFIEEMAEIPVLCCGWVGSHQGWIEVPYLTTPCKPPSLSLSVAVPTQDPRLNVRIIPGVKQIKPADVMYGEETQIAGVLAQNPDFDGIICLPGTHTKWVHISAGEIVSFRTFMSGELFSLLSEHSILRHSLQDATWDQTVFIETVNETLSDPRKFASSLFSVRADSLVTENIQKSEKSKISGLLIGLELGGARAYWLGQRVLVVVETELAKHYTSALQAQGADAEPLAGTEITLSGLVSIKNAEQAAV